ncbi:GlsB/YeaQ/YmgE family stress response membrane protein [Sphingomonas oleivorans]|uniref:GlsB/YeaQ/YmgE family stress response membrane protein n=2 Tax=Sphingomonas oleivorans TaxID=1735121 RepID=A0A2T5G273_9SPHN|nr:GlsB/YeaQ/YmgE family stress response membrane protein [Sphingomonas oleivorans]
MNEVGFFGAIIIGIFAGYIAEKVMKRDHGLLMNLVVGIGGALVGGFLARLLGIAFAGWIGSLVVSTIGAIILLWLVAWFRGRGGRAA